MLSIESNRDLVQHWTLAEAHLYLVSLRFRSVGDADAAPSGDLKYWQ